MDAMRRGPGQRAGIPGRTATLLVVSDGGGGTAEAAVEAAMAQFPDVSFNVVRRPGVRSREQVLGVVREAAATEGIVVHTIVIQEIRRLLVSECRLRLIPHFDLIGPLIGHISQEVGQLPILQPGATRSIDYGYFQRIDAIQFTVQHDDGQNIGGLDEADIILVGVSRSSKTPLSIYLSMRGWKVANIPIVLGIEPPHKLDEVDQTKIVALWIDLDHLIEIRRNRLDSLDQIGEGDYASPEQVAAELAFCRRIVRRGYPWPMVNVTGKSIEESAKEVVAVIERQRRMNAGGDTTPVPRRAFPPPDEFRPA